MENYVREDEAIINVIRRKRVVPAMNNYGSLRSSRNEGKNTNRTYMWSYFVMILNQFLIIKDNELK